MRKLVIASLFSISLILFVGSQTSAFGQRSAYYLELLGVGNGKCEQVVAWAGILNQEYEARRDNYGNAIYNRSLPLFSDEYFIPTFGKSFGEMKQKDYDKILKNLQSCYNNRKYANEINAITELRSMQIAFSGRADRVWTAENIKKDLLAFEEEKKEYQGYEAYLNGNPELLTMEELNKIGSRVGYSAQNSNRRTRNTYTNSGVFTFLWPSQITELTSNLETKIPLAQSNGIRLQIADIKSNSVDPIAQLRQINQLKNSATLASLGNAQMKSQFIQELDGMQNQLIQDQSSKELISLEQIPTDMSGFSQLSIWRQNLSRNYGDFRNSSAIQSLTQSANAKQEQLINQNKSTILNEVKTANSAESLRLVKGKYLGGMTSTGSLGTQIEAAANSRQYELDKAQADRLAQIQAEEQVELQEKLMEVTPDGQPTEFQMRTAYEFQIQAGNARMEREKEQAADIYKNQDMKQIMQLFTSLIPDANVELNNFSKIACQKAMNMPGYVCDFSAVNSTNVQGFNSIQSENEVKTARFVKMDNGVWQYIPLR